MRVAVIGTAGRDKSAPMFKNLWDWMVADVLRRVGPHTHLVSGGAAWADHLAVEMFLRGRAAGLTLHFPAPFNGEKFVGPDQSAASAANFYHDRFSQVLRMNTRNQIAVAIERGAQWTAEPPAPGYAAMFARNRKVSACDGMLAYTFGEGDTPSDGGTKNTWDQCRGIRVHVSLPRLPA